MTNDLTKGSIPLLLLRFSIPYLISSFLQTFYGIADLFIVSLYNSTEVISAVSIGSQVMHTVTVIIAGLSVGAVTLIARLIGKKSSNIKTVIKTIILFFSFLSLILSLVMLLLINAFLTLLRVPKEALPSTKQYLTICFLGIFFITLYNVISSLYRGLGDSKTPAFYVFIAGIINIVLDYALIAHFSLGAAGAAFATVISEAISVILISVKVTFISRRKSKNPSNISNNTIATSNNTAATNNNSLDTKKVISKKEVIKRVLKVGLPIAVQEGLIQLSFLVITGIANNMGVVISASVGITEKVISVLFLVNSAFLGSVCTIAAQNAGARLNSRASKTLLYGATICFSFGFLIFILCQFFAPNIISLFSNGDTQVIKHGAEYLRSYSIDCAFAGVHFVFSGYFCAYNKALYSFIHNIISVVTARLPLAYLASILRPDTLFFMGGAAPTGSLLSLIICLFLYKHLQNLLKKENNKVPCSNIEKL